MGQFQDVIYTATPAIHAALQQRELRPTTPTVDTGFLDAALLIASGDEDGVALLGPMRRDQRWQTWVGEGCDAQRSPIDWDKRQATCPAGRTSISWTPTINHRTNDVITTKFSRTDCRHCPHRAQCCRSQKHSPRRTIAVRPQVWHAALLAARARQETAACAMSRTRYIGQARTPLGYVFTAAARNFPRLGAWRTDQPRARARRSGGAHLSVGKFASGIQSSSDPLSGHQTQQIGVFGAILAGQLQFSGEQCRAEFARSRNRPAAGHIQPTQAVDSVARSLASPPSRGSTAYVQLPWPGSSVLSTLLSRWS